MSSEPKLWQKEEEELKAVLASDLFARAPSLAILLEYICRRRFNQEDHLIKEYNIAVEALGRPADFDQKKDSIVRVEAHRLRKRLKQYYQKDGATHEIEIEIPARGYAPVFRSRAGAAASAVEMPSDPGTDLSAEDQMWDELGYHTNSDHGSEPEAATVVGGKRRRPAWVRVGLGISFLFAVALAVGLARWKTQPADQPDLAAPSAATTQNTPGAGDSLSEVRIACGSVKDQVDREGHVWLADRYYQGGSAKSFGAGEVDGTLNTELFRTWREGAFTYRIPLKQGIYELTLSMAEPASPPGQPAPAEGSRLFDVVINGQVALNEFDLFADAGEANTADWKVFRDVSPDEKGFLVVEMRNRVGGALLTGISITPASQGRMRPIRVGMRERPYTDVTGRLWAEDRYFSGGKLVKRIERITGTEDPEIYRNERYGRLRYTIPVPADSTYTVVLHFAETWFGGTGKGGDGSRLFDVLCNGQMLLSSFDVHKEAGGPFRAITRVFRGVKPRENGKIVLEMLPSRNYAFLNAFEVLDESPGDGRPQPRQSSKR